MPWPRCYLDCDLRQMHTDDQALEALFINAPHRVGRPLPQNCVGLVIGVLTMWNTTSIILMLLHSGTAFLGVPPVLPRPPG